MRISKPNHNLLKLTFLAFTFTVLFSCQKDTRELEETQNKAVLEQVSSSNNLKGLSTFLNITELDKTLKASIDTNDYHYFSKSETDHLWIISLKPGTYGFTKSKIVANLKDGKFSMIIASYNYNTALYKKGDFSTYTGTTSLYNQKLQKLKDYVYEQGKLIEIKVPDCPTCVIFIPDVDPKWCDTYDPVCQGQYGDTDDLDNLMVNPDSGGGSTDDPSSGNTEVDWATEYPETTEIQQFEIDYRNQMTPQELEIYDNELSRNQQLSYLFNAKEAIAWAEEMYPNELHNGRGDAIRHAYFSALNARSLGLTLAHRLGDAHETAFGQPAIEAQMDTHNNQKGRDAYSWAFANGRVDSFFRTTIKMKIVQMKDAGELLIMSFGSLVPSY